ncbi:predicted protein [Botrytis cinerea T4]|uniref:Uncharacterized protein n=1 Tax=Botryotinia fuckeliana (strain T4) TaxID=999810 RepID=G2XNY1_BOTF4|nr:predicted protein [Botrytis cinerea T4]
MLSNSCILYLDEMPKKFTSMGTVSARVLPNRRPALSQKVTVVEAKHPDSFFSDL